MLRALRRAGIVPDVVCGTSVGAIVAAACAAGEAERLDAWVRKLDWRAVMGFMDWTVGGGLIQGSKLVEYFRARYEDRGIENLPCKFGCVATELATGREVWLTQGPVIDAVRASIAMPGLLTPVVREGQLLVDGGLVNPVPVSLCRALGAEIVIAVDLNWDLIGRRTRVAERADAGDAAQQGSLIDTLFGPFRERVVDAGRAPSLKDVMLTSLNIMQVRITQSRLAGEPAEILIRPRLGGIVAMDFHRGAIAAAEGERATDEALPMLHALME